MYRTQALNSVYLYIHVQPNVQDEIIYTIVNPQGNVESGSGSGVSRDVYSLYWAKVSDSYLIGTDQWVPFVRHDLHIPEWEAIGWILIKRYLDFRYFLIVLSYCFVHYCLYGEVDEEELIKGFLKYLSSDERSVIEETLKCESEDVYFSDGFIEIMEQFKCHSLVSKNNVKEVIVESSKQELYQKPHLLASCWKSLFYPLKTKFPNPDDLCSLYQMLEPTNKKVISRIIASQQNEVESECLQHFKKYVRSLDTVLLKHLLCFFTGAEILVVEAINVTFKKNDSKFTRTPIAHTCGPCLELPST